MPSSLGDPPLRGDGSGKYRVRVVGNSGMDTLPNLPLITLRVPAPR